MPAPDPILDEFGARLFEDLPHLADRSIGHDTVATNALEAANGGDRDVRQPGELVLLDSEERPGGADLLAADVHERIMPWVGNMEQWVRWTQSYATAAFFRPTLAFTGSGAITAFGLRPSPIDLAKSDRCAA